MKKMALMLAVVLTLSLGAVAFKVPPMTSTPTSANIEALAVIPSAADYAEIYFEDTMFWYSVRNSSSSTVNVYYETSNQTMSTTYEDADLEMIFFSGTPELTTPAPACAGRRRGLCLCYH